MSLSLVPAQKATGQTRKYVQHVTLRKTAKGENNSNENLPL